MINFKKIEKNSDINIPATSKTNMGIALNLQPDISSTNKKCSAFRNIILYGEEDEWYRVLSLSELDKIPGIMRSAGRIALVYSLEKDFEKYKNTIEESFKELIKKDGTYSSVLYKQDGLININGIYGYVGNKEFYFNHEIYRAFNINRNIWQATVKGDLNQFSDDMNKLLDGHSKAQILFSHLLTGLVKQFLEGKVLDLGELGIVISLQGESGSGKTTVTVNMVKTLFNSKNVLNKNMTNIALMNILKNAGVQPILIDDASVDNKNNKKHRNESTELVFNISQGNVRQKYNAISTEKVYAPYLESRESTLPLSKLIRSTINTEGQKFRFLEIHCQNDELLHCADVKGYNALSEKYTNMNIYFMRKFIDMQNDIVDIYNANRTYITDMLHTRNTENGWKSDDEDTVRKAGLEDRYANRLAVILTASDVAKEAYGIKFDKPAMVKDMIDEVEKFHRKMYGNIRSRYLQLLYTYINAAQLQIASDKKGFCPEKHTAFWESGSKVLCFNADYFCALFVLYPDENLIQMDIDMFWPDRLITYGKEHFKLNKLPEVSKLSKLFKEWNDGGFLYRSSTGYTFRAQITRAGKKVTYNVYKINVDELNREYESDEKVVISEYENYTEESEKALIAQTTDETVNSI